MYIIPSIFEVLFLQNKGYTTGKSGAYYYNLKETIFVKQLVCFVYILMLILCLTSCSKQEEEVNTPAQSQISEYTKKYNEECAEKENQQVEESNNNALVQTDVKNQEKKDFAPVGSLEINEHDIVLGDINSKIVVIEYIAHTCPHCAYYHKEIFSKIEEKYIKTNKVAYVVRNFIANKLDLDASILAYCAGDKELFMKFTNVLLQQQESWSLSSKYREILSNIGGLGGVSPEKYAACLNDNKLTEFIWANSQAVTKSPKFVGTPAFFINGVPFSAAHNMEEFSKAIDEAIALNAKSETIQQEKSE